MPKLADLIAAQQKGRHIQAIAARRGQIAKADAFAESVSPAIQVGLGGLAARRRSYRSPSISAESVLGGSSNSLGTRHKEPPARWALASA